MPILGQNDLKKNTANLRETKNNQQKYFFWRGIYMHISCVSYKTKKYNSDYKSFFRHVKYDQLKSVMIYISFFPQKCCE